MFTWGQWEKLESNYTTVKSFKIQQKDELIDYFIYVSEYIFFQTILKVVTNTTKQEK